MECSVVELKSASVEDDVYVLEFSHSMNVLAASLSSSVIALLSPETCVVVGSILHNNPINQIGFAHEHSSTGPNALYTLSNSTCSLWDVRGDLKQPSLIIAHDPAYDKECTIGGFGKGFLSGDLNVGTVFCAGDHAGNLIFWDLRNPGHQLGKLEEIHTEAVTQVRFHPSAGNVLFSGSDDGLVQKFDLNSGDPDDTLQCSKLTF
jgi:WD40 repeat protein